MGKGKALRLTPCTPLELYDLDQDVRETRDVAASHPDVVARIETCLKSARTQSERWPVVGQGISPAFRAPVQAGHRCVPGARRSRSAKTPGS